MKLTSVLFILQVSIFCFSFTVNSAEMEWKAYMTSGAGVTDQPISSDEGIGSEVNYGALSKVGLSSSLIN